MKIVCEVCGNKKSSMSLLCPFCGSKSEVDTAREKKRFVQKIVNLEAGRPIVELAMNRLSEIIQDALRQEVTVLTLIHGYGSTGKGGVIRTECRKTLDYMQSRKQIQSYLPGEEFNQRSGPVKVLLRRYPQLKNDRNLNKSNKGITFVILA